MYTQWRNASWRFLVFSYFSKICLNLCKLMWSELCIMDILTGKFYFWNIAIVIFCFYPHFITVLSQGDYWLLFWVTVIILHLSRVYIWQPLMRSSTPPVSATNNTSKTNQTQEKSINMFFTSGYKFSKSGHNFQLKSKRKVEINERSIPAKEHWE